MLRYDDHADERQRERLLARLQSEVIALVSDAGTPLISDPGYRLVRAAHKSGARVTVVPGPCAAIAGLTLSGMATDRFLFAGFLPARDKARREALRELGEAKATLVLYESPARLVRTLETIASLWPEREVAVARELTKRHEELRRAHAAALAEHYRAHPPKGEIVLMLAPVAHDAAQDDPEALLVEALRSAKPSQAAAKVAAITGLDRKALYRRALELRRK